MTPRVVHYVDSDVFGGNEQAALHLMASLDRSRWEPVLLHHPDPGIARLVDGAARLGIRTHTVPRVKGRLAGSVPLWRAIRAERPTVFHAHLSWPFACASGVLAARLARVPAIVGTAQLYLAPGNQMQVRLMLRMFRRIIAVSQEVRARYENDLGIPAGKLAVVPNAISLPPNGQAPDPALRRALVQGRPDYVVLTPARLHPQKGHAYLLAAAAQVPDATFVLAGDGPLRSQLEAQARELGIADRCIFLGHRSDVPELLAAADLLVLPSLFEGLPLSVLEAMAAQRPVVATAIGGTEEAVTHEETGLLAPPRDPVALASSIRRLRSDPALARRLAVAGRERVEREFSAIATAGSVMRIYDEVVGEAGAAAISETPEQRINARLRRADWRFLLPTPRPRRVLCRASGDLADAVASIADEVMSHSASGDCDLAVAEDPDPATLVELHTALSPGGMCYTEWHLRKGGPGRVAHALEAAGFQQITCYRPWPAWAASPVYWIPLGAPGAAAYVRSRARLRGGRLRRLRTGAWQTVRNLLRGSVGSPICAVARRAHNDGPTTPDDPGVWLRARWPQWNLGRPPEQLSTLLVTGGPRSVSKAVLLAFAEPRPVPLVAVKAPRVEEAAAGIRREGAALASLGARYGENLSGVPRLLMRHETDGVPLVVETALCGQPLESLLSRRNHGMWSAKVVDWLAALAQGSPVRPASFWLAALVEPMLSRFVRQFGAVVDRDLLRQGEVIIRSIGALPAVPEQRDFGPWNLLVAPTGELAVLDWESAEVEGLPALDLLYYLAYATFYVDGARDRESRVASYRRALDPSTTAGVVRREALARYLELVGVRWESLAPLRVLLWLIHAQSDFRHATADAGGTPPDQALGRSLFLALWAEEVRSVTRE